MPSMTIEEREARITEIKARLKDIDAANAPMLGSSASILLPFCASSWRAHSS